MAMTEARVKRPALKAAERRAWQSAGNGRRGERTVELAGKMPVVIGLLLYAAGQAAVKLYGRWIPKFANIYISRLTSPMRPSLAHSLSRRLSCYLRAAKVRLAHGKCQGKKHVTRIVVEDALAQMRSADCPFVGNDSAS